MRPNRDGVERTLDLLVALLAMKTGGGGLVSVLEDNRSESLARTSYTLETEMVDRHVDIVKARSGLAARTAEKGACTFGDCDAISARACKAIVPL